MYPEHRLISNGTAARQRLAFRGVKLQLHRGHRRVVGVLGMVFETFGEQGFRIFASILPLPFLERWMLTAWGWRTHNLNF